MQCNHIPLIDLLLKMRQVAVYQSRVHTGSHLMIINVASTRECYLFCFIHYTVKPLIMNTQEMWIPPDGNIITRLHFSFFNYENTSEMWTLSNVKAFAFFQRCLHLPGCTVVRERWINYCFEFNCILEFTGRQVFIALRFDNYH